MDRISKAIHPSFLSFLNMAFIIAAALAIIFAARPAQSHAAEDPIRGPWGPQALPATGIEKDQAERGDSFSRSIFISILRFYSDFISPIDGPRCPMYPTDAAYARAAIQRHGAFVGILMTVDRLLHEWSEIKRAPVIIKYGVPRFYDPVENNDFWFSPAR